VAGILAACEPAEGRPAAPDATAPGTPATERCPQALGITDGIVWNTPAAMCTAC